MRNFKQLLIWQKGFQITINAINLVTKFPKEEKFNLSSQISRAAVSIPSNIAEGSSRKSPKEFSRYLEIALGSSFELETQILIAEAAGYGENDIRRQLLKDIDEGQKMIMSFMNKLAP
jgi:four helix bundle protein